MNGRNNEWVCIGEQYTRFNIAVGLCAIGMNIYNCGNHTTINKRYNIIYNNQPDMYLLNCSEYCDSIRTFY